MAITQSPGAGPSTAVPDPILKQVAETNTFDCDWDTLKQRLHVALIASLPVFLARGPRRAYVHRTDATPRRNGTIGRTETPPTGSASTSGLLTTPSSMDASSAPPSDSLLLSPDRPKNSLESQMTGQPQSQSPTSPNSASGLGQEQGDEKPDTGSQAREGSGEQGDEGTTDNGADDRTDWRASTPGGLVIPPFKPLDPNRRRNGTGPVTGFSSVQGLGGPGRDKPMANGHAGYDDDWDEEVIIGGKKLPEWFGEEDGKKEVERVSKILDELDEPPFTIQRLSELLLAPTKTHTSLGKFLRSIEKSLLVTTSWDPPSYVPLPVSYLPGVPGSESMDPSSPASASSSRSTASPARSTVSLDDEESMMPPGSATPMFSPIPFLARSGSGGDGDMEVDTSDEGGAKPALDDGAGLMSPLMLGGESSPNPGAGGEGSSGSGGGFQFAPSPPVQVPGGRSPTPEPEPKAIKTEVDASSSTGASRNDQSADNRGSSLPTSIAASEDTTKEPSDPGHQSYLGRVDELDTGPVHTAGPPPTDESGTDTGRVMQEEAKGAGEGGNMVQHGMSEKPVPLSSTTVVKDEEERKIAPVPSSKVAKTLQERFTAGSSDTVATADDSEGEPTSGEDQKME